MIQLRKSGERGHANHGWLDSYHSFSFAEYYDPAHIGYSVLRVINEDKIAPAMGFGTHPHRNMEIITYMLKGELRHQDSMGNGSVIRAGDVQRMTAGSGIRHSEVNASIETEAHLLQIWLLPERDGLPPSYEDKSILVGKKLNQWCLIASNDARENSLKIHQDVELWASILELDQALQYEIKEGRCVYLQLAYGQLTFNQHVLSAGDAVMVSDETTLEISATLESEFLLFDLPVIKK
jgi:quercetin 2,3-dioxygenase